MLSSLRTACQATAFLFLTSFQGSRESKLPGCHHMCCR